MGLIIKIAWRNIFRHYGKSLIIGVILFLGALIMTVGNGVISGMNKGLSESIVQGFTGDIVLISGKQESDNVFFSMMGKAVEPINNFVSIRQMLKKQDYIERFLPIGKNMAMVLNEEGGAPGMAYLIGVDFPRYLHINSNSINVIEGSIVDSGNAGVLMPTGARDDLFTIMNSWYVPDTNAVDTSHFSKENSKNPGSFKSKNSIVFMGFNNDNTSTDIRVPVTGIIKYQSLNKIWGNFIFIDIESYRRCLGYFSAEDKAVEIPREQQAILDMSNESMDAMFTDEPMISQAGSVGTAPEKKVQFIESSSAQAETKTLDVDDGAYNMVCVLLKDGVTQKDGLTRLNAALQADSLGVRAVAWQKAMGPIGGMTNLIKGALFMFVMFLFFVAIIIIVNTLSMAALERTSEIGMMRAIGARKSFIGRMFFGETAMLSFVFGGLGIITGIIIVDILAMLNITSDRDMVQLLFGGDTFHPILTITDIIVSIVQLTIVTLIAMVYPMKVARNITPLEAIARD